MSHKELAESLKAWFVEVGRLPVWVRIKSPVWVVLRENLRVLGHWRARPRGNPSKGFKVSRERMGGDQ